MVVTTTCFQAVVRHNIMMERGGRGKVLTSWWSRSRGKGLRQDIASKDSPRPSSPRPHLRSLHHFLVLPSNYELINELIQWWGQSSQDPVIPSQWLGLPAGNQVVNMWDFWRHFISKPWQSFSGMHLGQGELRAKFWKANEGIRGQGNENCQHPQCSTLVLPLQQSWPTQILSIIQSHHIQPLKMFPWSLAHIPGWHLSCLTSFGNQLVLTHFCP
jgi:hypothetical protein